MVRPGTRLLAVAALVMAAGCGADNSAVPNARARGAGAADAASSRPSAPGAAFQVQIDNFEGYEKPVAVRLDCVANPFSSGGEKGVLFRMALPGTISCDPKYMPKEKMSERDLFCAFLVEADGALAPGEATVKWAQLDTREVTMTSWVGSTATIETVDEGLIVGRVKAGTLTGQSKWSFEGEFVAERCSNNIGE